MKTVQHPRLICVLCLCVVLVTTLLRASIAPAQTRQPYKKDECVRCHPGPVGNIATAGGKHRSVPCVGCHAGHPPNVKKPIAPCSKCHFNSRKAHFGITGCLNCHTNPHTPLQISFKGKDACLNCHAREVEQLSTNKSRHSALNCSMCHDVHRKIPECSRCHVPHSDKMIGECKQCHKAHTPKLVFYAADLPSQNCGACHEKAFDLLSATTTKHKTLKCAFCHKDKHRKIAICKDCHGSPHPKGIMVKFPQCGRCHNIAHDLNNWNVAASTETPTLAPKQQ
jgi:hypothetical protein